MKYLISVVLLSLTCACSAKLEGVDAFGKLMSPSANGDGTARVVTDCTNFNGVYQGVNEQVEVTQKECTNLTLKSVSGPASTSEEYITDGLERTVDGNPVKAYFQDRTFVVESKLDGENGATAIMKSVYQLGQTRCAGQAPVAGSTYLTMEIFITGSPAAVKCSSWTRK